MSELIEKFSMSAWPSKQELYGKTRIQNRDDCHEYALNRLAEVGPDKMLIATIADTVDNFITTSVPILETKEGNDMTLDFITEIKAAIKKYEDRGEALR